MKLEEQVCSLELAKKLKELGVKQESLFYWSTYDDGNSKERPGIAFVDDCNLSFMEDLVSAYTVAELGEMLKTKSDRAYLAPVPVNGRWNAPSVREGKIVDLGRFGVMTEADARAKMLIYLIENKLINTTK